MSDDHDSLISSFTNVTGVDADRAKFYLESSDWKIQEALTTFFDSTSVNEVSDSGSDPEIVEMTEPSEQKPENTRTQPKAKPASGGSRFATLNTLTRDESDEEEGQAFYAGGSDHSGQQVLGPRKKKDFVDEMFKSVQEHGAEVVDPTEASSSRGPNVRFTGTGYRLGATENDTEVVQTSSSASTDNKPVDVVLKMWRDGFSINDGPLREYTDPSNQDFLNSIRHGEIPRELVQQAGESIRREINLDMEDHRHEKFVQAKPKLKAFMGQGHTLGSPAPVAVGAISENVQDLASNEQQAKETLKVDSSQPTTNIQIRLADGSRLVGQFNHSHTIQDIRSYITTARPQYSNQQFALLSTFPSRELSDSAQTLEQAGILNAAIMQRLK